MTKISGATIMLVDNSTSGSPPRTFAGQTVEYDHESDITRMGVDGILSVAPQPWNIFWHGGRAKDLEFVTNVEIRRSDGQVLINRELIKTFEIPRDVGGGVTFQVF